ncbi:hypothetical protein RVO90_04815 [Enterobacter chengduensis]|uniref:hypothetical protein n=1 Tax=Enterobacter chengduensis TaxID=2494701 RepID=UPI002929288C|nr:hypothetical protein [Enterobacter chengduensis]MDV0365290.1 hypothetical protein [Enterobacter chengduensis]
MKSVSLPDIYRSTNSNTIGIWEDNAGIGQIREENYYDPVKLALATGIKPRMPLSVSQLIDELNELTKGDPLADIQPAHSFHFTFLPLTLPLYKANERLPSKVDQLKNIWSGYHSKKIAIRHLRLIALPSQLLLAGIPDEPAVAMRQSFCEKVLESNWEAELLKRHSRSPLPAPFWHSTILRYSAAFMPGTLREFFLKRQESDYGDVVGELTLARISYNWEKFYPLAI